MSQPRRYRSFSDFERDMDASLRDTTDFDQFYGLDMNCLDSDLAEEDDEDDDKKENSDD